MSIDSINYYVL